MKEQYHNIKKLLLIYDDHKWVINEDLKMVNYFIGHKEVTQSIHAFSVTEIVVQVTLVSDSGR